MPLTDNQTALLGAGIGAAAGLGQTYMNNQAIDATNQANIAYANQAYTRSRKDSLEDWNRQNEYNSPEAQMRRFKAAGLNPNLIYGQTNTAAPVRSAEYKTPNLSPKNFR